MLFYIKSLVKKRVKPTFHVLVKKKMSTEKILSKHFVKKWVYFVWPVFRVAIFSNVCHCWYKDPLGAELEKLYFLKILIVIFNKIFKKSKFCWFLEETQGFPWIFRYFLCIVLYFAKSGLENVLENCAEFFKNIKNYMFCNSEGWKCLMYSDPFRFAFWMTSLARYKSSNCR